MNKRQRADIDSINRVNDFNSKYKNRLSNLPEYTQVRDIFNQAFSEIHRALRTQTNRSGIDAPAVNNIKLQMAQLIHNYASKGAVKAFLAHDLTLQNQLTFPLYHISQAAKNIAIAIATQVKETIKSNLTILTNISPDDIILMEDSIKEYSQLKDKPTIQIQAKKAYGTSELPHKIKLAKTSIKLMFSLLRSEYKKSAPQMVTEFELAKKIKRTGVRHNRIKFTINSTNTEIKISHATVFDNSKQKTYDTQYTNTVEIKKHQVGIFTFTISAPGHITQTVDKKIKPRVLNAFKIQLKPDIHQSEESSPIIPPS